jgi:hypothetical protein
MPEFSPADQPDLDKLLGVPIFFPDEFKTWLADYVATNIPLIPFQSFLGARLNIARSGDYIATEEGTTSASYVDLATVGPQITGLVNGVYLALYGARLNATDFAGMSISVNGGTPSDDDMISSGQAGTMARGSVFNLQQDHNNSLRIKYKNIHGGLTKNFSNRWLVAIRVSTGVES